MTKIQSPPGTSEVSHGGQPFHIDPSTGQFECPEDAAPHFLRIPGFSEIPGPKFDIAPPTEDGLALAATLEVHPTIAADESAPTMEA